MQAWWESLSQVLRVLYCIAVPSTLVLVLQMLLSMMGGHGDGGIDISDTSGLDLPDHIADFDLNADADLSGGLHMDFHGHGVQDGGNPADFTALKLLTVQTLVTFLATFSWVSIICVSTGLRPLSGIAIGTVCGLAMMAAVAKMVQSSRRLAENGILNLRNAIGETGSVYLTVPPKGEGNGKVTMQLQGRFGEFDAINAGDRALPTGELVLVTDVLGDALVVESAG